MSQRWVQSWQMPSESRAGVEYTVSVSDDGTWGCSCPRWKFKRVECHHIQEKKLEIAWKDDDPGMIMKLKAKLINRYTEKGKTEAWIEKKLCAQE